MARVVLDAVGIKSAYVAPASALAYLNFVDADTGDGNAFVATGREILLARNTSTATPVNDENLNQSPDVGANEIIALTLAGVPVPGSLVITDASSPPQVVEDDGNGTLVGDVGTGGTKTVDYVTGAISFSFAAAPVEDILADYATGTNKTVTVTSVANAKNRTGNITARKVGAGQVVALPFFKLPGWVQTDGAIYFSGEDANIEFAVLRLPG